MCWLLIRAFADTIPTGCDVGHVVEVRPDDCAWGALEGLPRFYRVQITGLDAARVKAKLEAADVTVNPATMEITGYIRDRLYRISLADLPAATRTTLQTTGQLVVSKTQASNYIRSNAGVKVTL